MCKCSLIGQSLLSKPVWHALSYYIAVIRPKSSDQCPEQLTSLLCTHLEHSLEIWAYAVAGPSIVKDKTELLEMSNLLVQYGRTHVPSRRVCPRHMILPVEFAQSI